MWGWIATGVVVVGGAILIRNNDSKIAKRNKERAEREDEERRQQATRDRRAAENADEELRQQAIATRAKLAPDVLADNLIIDSNIWMNERYDSFFVLLADVVADARRPLVLYGAQFDEMCNIKRANSFEGEKSKRARLAISRIERFQKQDLLHIEPITMDSQRGAYADPVILKLLIALNKSPRTVSFISDDKELRIRARELVRGGQATTRVIDIGDLKDDLETFARARDKRLV